MGGRGFPPPPPYGAVCQAPISDDAKDVLEHLFVGEGGMKGSFMKKSERVSVHANLQISHGTVQGQNGEVELSR